MLNKWFRKRLHKFYQGNFIIEGWAVLLDVEREPILEGDDIYIVGRKGFFTINKVILNFLNNGKCFIGKGEMHPEAQKLRVIFDKDEKPIKAVGDSYGRWEIKDLKENTLFVGRYIGKDNVILESDFYFNKIFGEVEFNGHGRGVFFDRTIKINGKFETFTGTEKQNAINFYFNGNGIIN